MGRVICGMLGMWVLAAGVAGGQPLPHVGEVDAQPVLAQGLRLAEALEFLGNPLPNHVQAELDRLSHAPHTPETVATVQNLLDRYCLAMVHINPEMRVKSAPGPVEPRLIEGGWTTFLVKVHNESGTRAELVAESPNAEPALHRSSGRYEPKPENAISLGEVANRFLELKFYHQRPMRVGLSGLPLEYTLLQIYTKDAGPREARLDFNVGQGTQDLGFRSSVDILFDCQPATKVVFRVRDHDGSPAMASFTITDGIERLVDNPDENPFPDDYRMANAQRRPWEGKASEAPRLSGIYPLPSRRVAAVDEYPDFFFQPQIYRQDGEHVMLPPGTYRVVYTRGPEYVPQEKTIVVKPGTEEQTESFELTRWVHMAERGWYSGDHHVHAGGCSHYESPEAGVQPEAMFRQALGEDLNVACVLTWGPCWFYQKQFFEGDVHSMSEPDYVMRYDVEVSGFPSDHAGHLCLLRLTEDDFPGTESPTEWPSWTLPILRWAQEQGGLTGYSHSGWGLKPLEETEAIPNYVMAAFDGIGANEYIVTVVHDAVDFISAGDTPPPWELNIWYHTLNCGFRATISGETDFPCIFDDRIGMARSYVPIEGELNFDAFVEELRKGSNYVSDGQAHLIDFKVNDAELGQNGSQLDLAEAGPVAVTAKVAAYLPETQTAEGAAIQAQGLSGAPYWHLEKCRIEGTRDVNLELVVNGYPVAVQRITADGEWNDVRFDYSLERSSWVALRILPAVHTNPIFVEVAGKPIRASLRSAEWCRAAVDRCWEMKSPRFRDTEFDAAKAAYDHARAVYDQIVAEAHPDTE